MNRSKNMCRHSSKNTDETEVASAAAVTLDDYILVNLNSYRVSSRAYQARNHFADVLNSSLITSRRNRLN
jgi:hypothetical protein